MPEEVTMKINNLIVIFYIIISLFVGAILIGFSLHVIDVSAVVFQINELYSSSNARITLGSIGALLIFFSLLFAQIISARREREKTIAFNNPSGQVTITLFAVEDLIRKIGQELPQIKEIRPDVIATKKKGLLVNIRLILRSELNIPEFTSQLQEIVRSKIQEILGVEEQITVKIHIAKIQTQQEKPNKKKKELALEQELVEPPRV